MSDNEEIPIESWAYELSPESMLAKEEKVHGGVGRKKTGGRKKGTPNRSTMQRFEGQYVSKTLNNAKCDPLESLIRVARKAEKAGNLGLAGRTYGVLMEYVTPKKREQLQADNLSALVFSWQAEPDTKEITGIVIDQVLGDDEIE
jgi:hypothetical protein